MNARRRLSLALVLVASLLAASCGSGTDTAAPTDFGGGSGGESDFPSFTAPTVGGSQLDFGSLEGQDTVLWFWAPW